MLVARPQGGGGGLTNSIPKCRMGALCVWILTWIRSSVSTGHAIRARFENKACIGVFPFASPIRFFRFGPDELSFPSVLRWDKRFALSSAFFR